MMPWLFPIACFRPAIVTLSGTSGTPILSSILVNDPANATSGWKFKSDGSVQRKSGGGGGTYATYLPGVQWINVEPGHTYYLRATSNAGDANTSGTLNTWLALSSDLTYEWTQTSIGTKTGSLKIEIATDSGGSDIVATGYYGGFSEVDSGV